MQKFKELCKYIVIFLICGGLYYLVEIAYRGYSHWTMFLLGGWCGLYADWQNEVTPWEYPFWKQVLKVEAVVLISEFITGCIVNLWLGWNVWSYENLPGNILGQTSWQFALLFLPLCAFAIVFSDYIRYWFFKEEKPRYKII